MKENFKKILALASIIALVGVIGSATVNAKSKGKGKSHSSSHHAKTKKTKSHKRTIPGRVLTIAEDGTFLTLKKGNKTYTVNIPSGTVLIDRHKNPITISDIKVGHKLSVKGTVSKLIVTASKIRDITIPIDTTDNQNSNTNGSTN